MLPGGAGGAGGAGAGGAGGAGAGGAGAGAGGAGANLNLIPEELEFSSPALLKKFWWISLYICD